jgi:hypothetical protein
MLLTKIHNRWNGLNERQRRTLAVAGAVAGVVVLLMGAIVVARSEEEPTPTMPLPVEPVPPSPPTASGTHRSGSAPTTTSVIGSSGAAADAPSRASDPGGAPGDVPSVSGDAVPGDAGGIPPRQQKPSVPTKTTDPEPVRPATYEEVAANRAGSKTFEDTQGQAMGPDTIEYGQAVRVSCKVLDTTMPSASPDGYWYRISSAPWNERYYAVANTFANGDPLGTRGPTNVDPRVPDC